MQVLFLQHVIDILKPGGRCGIVLDELPAFSEQATALFRSISSAN